MREKIKGDSSESNLLPDAADEERECGDHS